MSIVTLHGGPYHDEMRVVNHQTVRVTVPILSGGLTLTPPRWAVYKRVSDEDFKWVRDGTFDEVVDWTLDDDQPSRGDNAGEGRG
jgi:hypothetical protein